MVKSKNMTQEQIEGGNGSKSDVQAGDYIH